MNNFAVVTILLLVIAAGAGVFFYMNYLEPMQVEGEKIKTEIEGLERQKAQLSTIDEETSKLKNKISELEDQRGKLKTASNKLKTVVPKLLESTETVANKFDIRFQDIRISPLVRAEDWSELPIEMTVVGSFKNLGNFLTIMERRKIINLAAGSMNVSASAEPDKKTKSPLLSVTLSAKVYIMSERD